MSTEDLKIIIIGGGAAGFFAAIRAAELLPSGRVVLLERGKEVLGKVKISGGGRCNVTHACWDPRELSRYYPRGQRELLGPFHRFAPGDTVEWFESRGVPLKIEADGRMFPVSDNSQTIIDCLRQAADRAGVTVLLRQRVEQLLPPDNKEGRWQVATPSERFSADRVLVATGSNPAIWKLLESLGHTIVPPVPSLFTFNIKDPRIEELAGVSVPGASVGVENSKLSAIGPLLITHWGMSGPAILRLSAWGARLFAEWNYTFAIRVNWLDRSHERIREELESSREGMARRLVMPHSPFEIPARLWRQLAAATGIGETTRWADLSKRQLQGLADELTQGCYLVTGKSTFKEEFVTAGGVSLKEIDFKTFGSKILPGLFIAGEALDIDAITGGFNFQAAWTGGWIAGSALAGL